MLSPIPAAASGGVGDWPGLQAAMNNCVDGTTVQLTHNINEASGTLTVPCDAELDLNGHALTVSRVVINEAKQFIITGGLGGSGTLTANGAITNVPGIGTTGATLIVKSGTVNATGGNMGAGIGGGNVGAGGTVEIRGGTVTATGGQWGAGIGGGSSGAGGNVTIDGGTVTATGGERGAGIGGGTDRAGGNVTIDGGTVTATGGDDAAGIGGGQNGNGATVAIDGGSVTATGGQRGAGIGGGSSNGGGQVTIDGGTVTATGGHLGAGIGGGLAGAGGPVEINGGTVTAGGGDDAAGIGGGFRREGGTVALAANAVVTAMGGHTAIGGGMGMMETPSFGALTVAGTLHLPEGDLVITSGTVVTVASTGRLLGGSADPTIGANVVGGGRIANGGAIALATSRVTAGEVSVSGHHYRVTFDAADGSTDPDQVVTVFAPSFDTGHRDLPTDPTQAGQVFHGWTDLPDGAGSPITATSTLPGTSADGAAVLVTAHAHWTPTAAVGLTFTSPDDVLPAGGSRTLRVEVRDGTGNVVTGDNSTSVAFTKAAGVGTVNGLGTVQAVNGVALLAVIGKLAGLITLEATADELATGTTTFTVIPGAADAATSTITANPTSITADGTSTATITVQVKDAHGNDLTGGGDTVTLTATGGILSAVTDGTDGTYTATLTAAATTGTATVSGTLDGVAITDSATVTFTAASSTGPSPTPTPPPATPVDPVDPDPVDPDPVPPPPTTDRGTPNFTDVTGNTHQAAINSIHRYGITTGVSDTIFNPAGDISRGQMATFLVRLLVLTDPDIDDPDSHQTAMQVLLERGVLLGHADGNLNGTGTLTRGQAASLLVRLIEQTTGETLATGTTSFSDAGGTHGVSIAKLAELGVVSGYADNTYRPHLALRRDQAASLIARTIDELIEAGKIASLDA